jgi:hypothetical protein
MVPFCTGSVTGRWSTTSKRPSAPCGAEDGQTDLVIGTVIDVRVAFGSLVSPGSWRYAACDDTVGPGLSHPGDTTLQGQYTSDLSLIQPTR